MPDWNWGLLASFLGPALAAAVAGGLALLGVRHGLTVLRAHWSEEHLRNRQNHYTNLLVAVRAFGRCLEQPAIASKDANELRQSLWDDFRALVAGVNINGTAAASEAALVLLALFDANYISVLREQKEASGEVVEQWAAAEKAFLEAIRADVAPREARR